MRHLVDSFDSHTSPLGQFHEQILTEPAHITSTSPILVVQYANSAQFDDTLSDPLMMLITPSDRFLDDYTVFTGVTVIDQDYLNLTVPSEAVGAVRLSCEKTNKKVDASISSDFCL